MPPPFQQQLRLAFCGAFFCHGFTGQYLLPQLSRRQRYSLLMIETANSVAV
jgi:hypothetical protein